MNDTSTQLANKTVAYISEEFNKYTETVQHVKENQTGWVYDLAYAHTLHSTAHVLTCGAIRDITLRKAMGLEMEKTNEMYSESQTRFNYTNLDWNKRLENSKNTDDIINTLNFLGLRTIADRVSYLKDLTDNNTDGKPMSVESLRNAMNFIIKMQQWPKPQIVASHEGCTYLRWKIEQKSVLAMEFLPSGQIMFTAILYSSDTHSKIWSVNGTKPLNQLLEDIKPFTDKM